MRSSAWIGMAALFAATLPFTGGCAARSPSSGSQPEAPVAYVGTPTLVAVDGSVWVVRDSSRAVYHVDDHYWVYRDGVWSRAQSYEGPWVPVEASVVPPAIVSRDHTRYVQYHGDANAQTRPAPQGPALASAEPSQARPSTESPAPAAGSPPGHDDNPGVGNQRKAEGEQPGRAPHANASGAGHRSSGSPPQGKAHHGKAGDHHSPPPARPQATHPKKHAKKHAKADTGKTP